MEFLKLLVPRTPHPRLSLSAYHWGGNGILKVAKMVGCGSGTVQRVKKEMAAELVEGA